MPVEEVKKDNEEGGEIDKIHFGELEKFGVDGGEDEGGEGKEPKIEKLNKRGHLIILTAIDILME